MKWLLQNTLYLAWVVSLVGVLLSLFIGSFVKVEPCHLCWYQRVALFPLALMLGIASYKNDLKIVPYAIPLVIFGGCVALYQTVGLKLPFLFNQATCGMDHECARPVFTLFGFLTFPLLSAIGFALIGALLFLAGKSRGPSTNPET